MVSDPDLEAHDGRQPPAKRDISDFLSAIWRRPAGIIHVSFAVSVFVMCSVGSHQLNTVLLAIIFYAFDET